MNIKLVNKSKHQLPKYETAGAAGMDLRANIPEEKRIELLPNVQELVPTGIYIELPNVQVDHVNREIYGYEAQIRPRSGLAIKHGIGILNSPGTIDCDYRGEIKVIMINLSNEPYIVTDGDRIAQMVINRVELPDILLVDELSDTERGSGGFGHTDKKQ